MQLADQSKRTSSRTRAEIWGGMGVGVDRDGGQCAAEGRVVKA